MCRLPQVALRARDPRHWLRRHRGCARRPSPGEPLTFLPNRDPTLFVYVVHRQRARSGGTVPMSIRFERRQTPARTADSDPNCT